MSALRENLSTFASRYAPQLVLLGVLAVSRLIVHALGFHPDPAIVIDHWQNVDLSFLASDPFAALWTLHSQPPLWNSLLAVAVALVGPDGDAVTHLMYGFNLALTAGAGLMILSILRQFGFSVRAATAFTALAMCSPNVFYFETYIFYPHFTFFLVTLLLWLLVRVKRDGPLWPMAASSACWSRCRGRGRSSIRPSWRWRGQGWWSGIAAGR